MDGSKLTADEDLDIVTETNGEGATLNIAGMVRRVFNYWNKY